MPAGIQPITEYNQSWWSADHTVGAMRSQVITEYAVACLPHTHAEYAFVTCLAGRLEFIREGEQYALGPGDMLVHNPGQVHQSLYGAGGDEF